ncbi:hypothetical protein H9P43_006098 [Blastocladiella emersonii ATCC 22665]|nr:hypothetical protein H9P43_006098 [Blastocladiella emersonii ATCC 22665]
MRTLADSDLGAGPNVPPALTCPSRICDEQSDVFRPYGTAHPRDLLMLQSIVSEENRHLHIHHDGTQSVLLLGCGDLRDLARTLQDTRAKGGIAEFRFLLNDIRPEVLARNLLILHAVSTSAALVDETLARHVAQLWFSLLLEPDTRAFWEDQMRACLDVDWTDSPATSISVFDDETLRAVRHCWQSWLSVDWSVETLLEHRSRYLESHWDPAVRDVTAKLLAQGYVERNRARFGKHLTRARASRIECTAERHATDHTFAVDPASVSAAVVNPTFLLARADGTVYYAVPNLALPFESLDVYVTTESPDSRLFDEVWDWATALRASFARDAKPRHKLSVAVGHAIGFMERLAADPQQRFDIVDTNNLQDSVGLLNLLSLRTTLAL